MIIIKHGRVPDTPRESGVVTLTCQRCGTIFQADKSERVKPFIPDSADWMIECPLPGCGNVIHGNA